MAEPQVLTLRRRPINLDDYRDPTWVPTAGDQRPMRGARADDCATLVTESTVVVDADLGHPTLVYLRLPEDPDTEALRRGLARVRYGLSNRSVSTLVARTRTFGYQPRIAYRRDYCSAASLAGDDPDLHALIARYAAKVATYYQQFHPDLYAAHQQAVSAVRDDWRLETSPFTSGIINQNNALPYHHDAGNFRDVWSNMLGFKRDVEGGYLAVPEYDLAFEIADNSLTMFDGQRLLHGVTPFRRVTPKAYRYTIVYYSLKAMWKCLTPKDEVRRIQQVRTEREDRWAATGGREIQGKKLRRSKPDDAP